MVVETFYPVLSNYFLNPAGLLALTALIPLIIFYLIKKDPEREVMPSFMFFADRQDPDSTTQAFRKIARNLILLFHIIMVFAFASAIANPYLDSGGQPENAVLVLDRSASMEDLQDAKQFLTGNTGETNTVISAGERSRILAEEVPGRRARAVIEDIKPSQTGTDIVSGLERTRRFPGAVVVASDLDQTVNSRDPESILEAISIAGREVRIMDTSRRNLHGITGIEVGGSRTEVDIKNFETEAKTVQVKSGNSTREVEIEGESVATVEFENREGRNTVELPEDGFEPDNTAYYYIPGEKDIEVAMIGDRENRYISKAFELINFTSFRHHELPLEQDIEADIYILKDPGSMDQEDVRAIEQKVRSGSSLVLMGDRGFSESGFSELPVRDLGRDINRTVTISRPVETSLGEMEIREVEVLKGERYSKGSNAVVKSEYGEGEFLLYNIEDKNFRNSFVYPIFWKEISEDMSDRLSLEESNRKTGEEIETESITTPSGNRKSGSGVLENTGFYETSEGTIAVSLLNEDESLRDRVDPDLETRNTDTSKMSIQTYLIAIVLILTVIELGYLYRIGDIR